MDTDPKLDADRFTRTYSPVWYSKTLAFHKGLKAAEKELFRYLVEKSMVKGFAWARDIRMAEDLGVSERTIRYRLKKLEKAGMLRRITERAVRGEDGVYRRKREIHLSDIVLHELGLDPYGLGHNPDEDPDDGSVGNGTDGIGPLKPTGYRFHDLTGVPAKDRVANIRKKRQKARRKFRKMRRQTEGYDRRRRISLKYSSSRTSVVVRSAAAGFGRKNLHPSKEGIDSASRGSSTPSAAEEVSAVASFSWKIAERPTNPFSRKLDRVLGGWETVSFRNPGDRERFFEIMDSCFDPGTTAYVARGDEHGVTECRTDWMTAVDDTLSTTHFGSRNNPKTAHLPGGMQWCAEDETAQLWCYLIFGNPVEMLPETDPGFFRALANLVREVPKDQTIDVAALNRFARAHPFPQDITRRWVVRYRILKDFRTFVAHGCKERMHF